MISKKVILTGSFGVGKTSLFNQFIHEKFNDKYLTTIGVKVNKKNIDIEGEELSIMLWDIAGEVSQDKVPVSYFQGASGLIYVFDLTRPSTYKNIKSDTDHLRKMSPDALIKVVANKKDLIDEMELSKIMSEMEVPCDIVTSAKTGENVETLFLTLGKEMLPRKI